MNNNEREVIKSHLYALMTELSNDYDMPMEEISKEVSNLAFDIMLDNN